MAINYRNRVCALLAALTSGLASTGTNAAVTVLGVQYQPDQLFPEFDCIWHDKNYPTSCSANVAGCHLHVYVKNTGASSVTVSDATVKGYSMEGVLATGDIIGARSIYYNWDNPPDDIVYAVGEPVWYRAVPSTIPAGGVGQVVVRLRYIPTDPALTVGVVTSGGTVATNVTVDANAPQLARVGFISGLTNVTLHWRRSGGAAPTSIWMDGVNVTANTITVGDTNVNFAASVISLAAPLSPMSYHVFQGVYADGKTATAGLRAWANRFIYATYGVFDGYSGHDWIVEASDHGVNNCQLGGMGSYLSTSAGQTDAFNYDFGYTTQDIAHLSTPDPDMWFLNDEPDAQEDNQANTHCNTGLHIPCGSGHSTGILVMSEIAHGESLQAVRPMTATTVNMDGTLKPNNYISWGQAMDVLQVDPYYQRRLSDTYWYYPERISLYKKATYVYAVSRGVAAAAEPNPSNVLLYSCSWKDPNTGQIWPFPTPESKRIEVYYALAGGATGMGYWWLNPNYPSKGIGDQSTPEAKALWKEMGLLGNEIKTARPLLVRSTPVNVPLTPSTNVWSRSLASGTDTIILLVVNDNYYNDIAGCHYANVNNATVTATLPSWMQSPSAFEISASGLSDVSTQPNGNQLQLNLGTLKLTKMIVLTKNAQLRGTIQQWYDQKVRPGICNIAPELCVNTPPSIAQQPFNKTVAAGGTTTFTVVVSGSSPFTYQWQKNNANLGNGGHYSGATTGTVTISGADANDVASYRCVVTNAYGNATSSSAALTLGVAGGCPDGILVNAGFEGGTNANGVAVGWTGYQRTPNPTTVWTIQIASPPAGGGLQYQQIANTSSTGGGGVRQDVTGCTIGATYTVAGWMRGNSVSATCTVKCSPSVSTSWATAGDLTPLQTYTGPNWTPFSGTMVATGTSMTIWLDGQTGGTGLNKAECFDSVTVTCANAPASLHFDSVTLQTQNQVRLVLGGAAGGSVTILRSSNLVDWVSLTNLILTGGTVEFTDPAAANVPRRFYRATSP